jgi:hypothetical protein
MKIQSIPFASAPGAVPGGPMAGPLPKGGPRTARTPGAGIKRPKQNFSSKKGYTGSKAGLGRMPNGTVKRSGPQGPRGFGGSTLLPKRMQGLPAAAGPRPARAPSLFARVRSRLRRAAAAFGL